MPEIFLFLGIAVVYWVILLGAEYLNEGVSTLLLAGKTEPLFVGLVATTVVSTLPFFLLAGFLAQGGFAQAALGVVLGGGFLPVVLPMAIAASIFSVALRKRWVNIDLPMLIGFWAMLFALEQLGARAPIKTPTLLVLGVVYLVFRYVHGKSSCYGPSAFGRGFSFGVSTESIIGKTLIGALALVGGCYYLGVCAQGALIRWQLPPFVLGATLTVPLCISEVTFALSAVREGKGEVILGRGLGMATLILTFGAGLFGWLAPEAKLPITDTLVVAGVGLLALLWMFLRLSGRFWEWQARLILALVAILLLTAWVQSCEAPQWQEWLKWPPEIE